VPKTRSLRCKGQTIRQRPFAILGRACRVSERSGSGLSRPSVAIVGGFEASHEFGFSSSVIERALSQHLPQLGDLEDFVVRRGVRGFSAARSSPLASAAAALSSTFEFSTSSTAFRFIAAVRLLK